MIITLREDMVNALEEQSSEVLNSIKHIFSLVSQGMHTFLLDDDLLEEIFDFFRFSVDDQRGYRKIAKHALRQQKKVIVTVSDLTSLSVAELETTLQARKVLEADKYIAKDDIYSEFIDFSDVHDYLGYRLQIYLENVTNDKHFFRGFLKVISEKEFTEVDICGGGGINNLSRVLEGIERLHRVICIVDSDKRFPGHQNPEISNLQQICTRKGFHCFVLNKRMIENYLPDRILKQWLEENNLPIEHEYFQMNQEQKDCFHLKGGLKKKHLNTPEIRKLYETFLTKIDQEKLDQLSNDGLVFNKLGNEMAALFETIHVQCTRDDFDRSTIREITDITNLIERYI